MIELLQRYNFWDEEVSGCGVTREFYLQRLLQMEPAKSIITVTGGRRVGKSVLVRQFIRHLIKEMHIDPRKIFYANLFIQELDFLKNRNVFVEAVEAWKKHFNFNKGERLFIVIDEIQEIDGWELLVSSLYENYKTEYKIVITGSNAKLLSGELHTYLAGRSFELTLFPFSFNEYASFLDKLPNRELCLDYLQKGGMPEIIAIEDSFARRNLIASTIDSIVMRDIALRHDIRNIALLRKLVDYFCASPSDEVSKLRIKNLLQQSGEKTSINTVSDYVEYLKEALFIHECMPFSYKKGDILQKVPKKVYLNDPAFARSANGANDFGKLLENIVYIHLLRMGYRVDTMLIGKKEIDFRAQKENEKIYVQVAYTIGEDGSDLFKREFEPLMMIRDHYPKYVVSLDELIHAPVNGIIHLSVVDILKNGFTSS